MEICKSSYKIKKKCLILEKSLALDNNSGLDDFFPGQPRKFQEPGCPAKVNILYFYTTQFNIYSAVR